jgi:putative ABC transport system permease protein
VSGSRLGIRLIAFNRLRLLAAFSGMAVAVVIMFVELGLLLGVLDSQAMMADLIRGDLLVMSSSRTNLHKWNELDRIRLSQIASLSGVADAIPVYQSTAGLKSPDDDVIRRIVVIAFPTTRVPLAIGDEEAISRQLATPQTILFDRRSRPIFGTIVAGKDVELDGRLYRVGGFVDIGPDIVNDGAVVMSEGDWLSRRPNARPIMGVIRVQPGADVAAVKRAITAALPNDVSVFTPAEVKDREIAFTLRSAPIGILFGIGMLAGLVIGSITCYQILFNEIVDRMKQYAMLKAMGFSDFYLRRMILAQAILLSCGGFLLGLAVAYTVYAYIAKETALAVQLSLTSGSVIFALAAGMSIAAGLLAMRRVRTADPAELY